MAVAFLLLVAGRYNHPRAILFSLGLAYAVISFYALKGKRWATFVSILVALTLMIRWLPMVTVNAWMFFTDHALYNDSPATIFVVMIYAIIFAIPSTALCGLYIAQIKRIWQHIRYGVQ